MHTKINGFTRKDSYQYGIPGQEKGLKPLQVEAFINPHGLIWTLLWWRRRESNPRPQMLPSRIYMLSLQLEDSPQICRGNKADLALDC
jgi:hypothetical protein